jgi:hypothetical protein
MIELPENRREAAPESRGPLPFAVGEKLIYRASIPRFRGGGTGEMSVKEREIVRGRETFVLDFEFSGRVALASVSDHTTSWLDPEAMAARRFHKREKSPISSTELDFELFPDQHRWEATDGSRGRSLTSTPLDELSFLYFVRTLPLVDGESVTVEHHFDAARNPVVIYVVGRTKVRVPAGEFDVVVVEMRVHDTGRFGGSGRVRLHLTDDERRIPVRMETSVPVAGTMILSLESWVPGARSSS